MNHQSLISILTNLNFVFSIVNAIPIDNGVRGFPDVVCGVHGVKVDVDTEKSFLGRVFVKGESEKKECFRSFVLDETTSSTSPQPYKSASRGETVSVELAFGQCNMRRQRTLNPKGFEYSFTLIVSFHTYFITKVDKAYRIRCFYMEAEKTVAQQLDVSMLTTAMVDQQFSMPTCQYNIRRDSKGGPPVRFAAVGEQVFHVWECDSSANVMYGMLVKSCLVDDGNGNKVELINDKGCSIDKHLIPNLEYNKALTMAATESHVFKYADKPSLFFTCSIVLCLKEDDSCNGITPPICANNFQNDTSKIGPPKQASTEIPNPFETYASSVSKINLLAWLSSTTAVAPLASAEVNLSRLHPPYAKRKARDVRREPRTAEADVNADPLIVLPFDEQPYNDKDFSDLEAFRQTQEALNEAKVNEIIRWLSTKVAKKSATRIPEQCVSSTSFATVLLVVFFLTVFSALVTVMLIRTRYCAIREKELYYES